MVSFTVWQLTAIFYLFGIALLIVWHSLQHAAGEVARDNIVLGYCLTFIWPFLVLVFIYGILLAFIRSFWTITKKFWNGWA